MQSAEALNVIGTRQRWCHEQPRRGVVGAALVVAFSQAILWPLDAATVNGWLAFGFMSATPAMVMVGFIWQPRQYPTILRSLRQPLRGLFYLKICIAIGALVGTTTLHWVGLDKGPPAPPVMMYLILSVVLSFWYVILWHGWPFALLSRNPLGQGILMLIMVYGLGWLLFRSCFDFGFLRGTDLYVEAMDPKGRFNAWQAICASVLSVSVIYALVLLDFYPISLLKHWSAPARSAAASVLVLIVAGAIYWLTTQIMGIDPVKVLAYGPVCFIFGALMFLLPFQRYAFSALAQPAKGATQIGVCVLLGAALSGIFLLSTHFHGDHVMQSGLPTYEQELWLSSALLGLTFPLIVIYSDFLNSWPIEKGT